MWKEKVTKVTGGLKVWEPAPKAYPTLPRWANYFGSKYLLKLTPKTVRVPSAPSDLSVAPVSS